MNAYRRGMTTEHLIGDGGGKDLHIEWRVAVACWAAQHGASIPGDSSNVE